MIVLGRVPLRGHQTDFVMPRLWESRPCAADVRPPFDTAGERPLACGLPLDRQARLFPFSKPAVHADDVAVPHFLQVVGRERGTETASAVQHDL